MLAMVLSSLATLFVTWNAFSISPVFIVVADDERRSLCSSTCFVDSFSSFFGSTSLRDLRSLYGSLVSCGPMWDCDALVKAPTSSPIFLASLACSSNDRAIPERGGCWLFPLDSDVIVLASDLAAFFDLSWASFWVSPIDVPRSAYGSKERFVWTELLLRSSEALPMNKYGSLRSFSVLVSVALMAWFSVEFTGLPTVPLTVLFTLLFTASPTCVFRPSKDLCKALFASSSIFSSLLIFCRFLPISE